MTALARLSRDSHTDDATFIAFEREAIRRGVLHTCQNMAYADRPPREIDVVRQMVAQTIDVQADIIVDSVTHTFLWQLQPWAHYRGCEPFERDEVRDIVEGMLAEWERLKLLGYTISRFDASGHKHVCQLGLEVEQDIMAYNLRFRATVRG